MKGMASTRHIGILFFCLLDRCQFNTLRSEAILALDFGAEQDEWFSNIMLKQTDPRAANSGAVKLMQGCK